MNRRDFLKTLLSLGASISVPTFASQLPLGEHWIELAPDTVVNDAWTRTVNAWGLFEMNEYGTLSFANFEEPKNRREGCGIGDVSEFEAKTLTGIGRSGSG
jgi:hypothetical protein